MQSTCKPLFDADDRLEERASIDERLLLWLLKHPFQRLDDLALALLLHPSSVSRHLDHLQTQGFVEAVKPALFKRTYSLFYLTTKGIMTVAHLLGAVPEKLARMWEVNERSLLRLLPRLPSLVMVQEVIASLVSHAPRALALPSGHLTHIRWHWVRDWHHQVMVHSKRLRCLVDAALVFSRPPSEQQSVRIVEGQENTYMTLLVLLDTGLVGNTDLTLIRSRFEHLLLLRESPERWSYYHQFPPVVVITSSDHSRQLWRQCASEAATRLRLAPLQGAVVACGVEEGIGERSAWVLPWQHLSSGGGCRLAELLQPIERVAVLPGLLAPKAVPHGTFLQACADSQTAKRRSGNIVKGHFSERAKLPLSLPSLNVRAEQENVALLSLRIAPRHREILLALYAHPFLSRSELAVLLDLKEQTLQRYLFDLGEWSCLIVRSTTANKRFHLSSRGVRLMAFMHHCSLSHLIDLPRRGRKDIQQRGVKGTLFRLRHTTGLYRFLTHLKQAARLQNHQLLWWETGARCGRRYHFQGAWHNLLPDVALAYQAGEQRLLVWIEWDEGTMKPQELATKMAAYAQYVRARVWMKEGGILPLLLVIVPDPAGERRVQQVIAHYLNETPLLVRTTTQTLLDHAGPLASIWLPVLPIPTEQPGATDEPRALRRSWLLMSQR